MGYVAVVLSRMMQLEIVLLSFPCKRVISPKLKNTTAAFAWLEEPFRVQLVITLFVASLTNRTVPLEAAVFVLSIIRELPPEFNPLIVTKSEPFKSITWVATLPLIVLLP